VRIAGHDGEYVGEGATLGQAVAAAYAQHEEAAAGAWVSGLTLRGLLLVAGDELARQHAALHPAGCPGCGCCRALLPVVARALRDGGLR
jgi:hypothetical protein